MTNLLFLVEIFELKAPNLAYLLKSELMKIIKKQSRVRVIIIIYFQFSEPLTAIIALKVFHRVFKIDPIFYYYCIFQCVKFLRPLQWIL